MDDPMKDDHPVYATKNSLKYTKKGISHFMVHTHIQWNDITKFGNPTRSKKVNALIRLGILERNLMPIGHSSTRRSTR